jgi:antitoxin component YwqK of YwqJK toxin-antitoxin module
MKSILMVVALLSSFMAVAQENIVREFYADGSLKSVQYVSGERIRTVKYHENGTLSEKGWFANGQPDGTWVQYDPNGELVARVQYDEGKRNGKWMIRSVSDNTMMRLQYRNGKLVKGEQLNSTGEVIALRDEH